MSISETNARPSRHGDFALSCNVANLSVGAFLTNHLPAIVLQQP